MKNYLFFSLILFSSCQMNNVFSPKKANNNIQSVKSDFKTFALEMIVERLDSNYYEFELVFKNK